MNTNSREYWDDRFENDWDANEGREQTLFFARILYDNLNVSLKRVFQKYQLEILDWGCGDGGAVGYLRKIIPGARISGLDFSKKAIQKARKFHPDCVFYDESLEKIEKKFNVIYSSNCLEHFHEPEEIFHSLASHASDYLIIMVPFQEYDRIPEHFVTFDFESFSTVRSGMMLIDYKIINTALMSPSHWNGKQLLLVYANPHAIGLSEIDVSLGEVVTQSSETNALMREKGVLQKKLAEKEALVCNLVQDVDSADREIAFIKSSKFWKLRGRYMNMTSGFDSRLFVLKYSKRIIDTLKPAVPLSLRRRFGNTYNTIFSVRPMYRSYSLTDDAIGVDVKKTTLDIFLFPVIDWDFRFQRPQQLCRGFVKNGARVFYVSTRTNIVSGRLTYENIKASIGIRRIETGVFEISLASKNALNIYSDRLEEGVDLWCLEKSVQAVRERFDIGPFLSIIDLPFWYPLVSRLKDVKIIYDCMDDHSGFSNNSKRMLAEEEDLFRKANLVLASSHLLFEKAMQMNEATLQVKNAADVAHFSRLPESNIKIRDIGAKGPVIGYYGAIAEWFDVDLVLYCATKRSDYQFVLIGRVSDVDISDLMKLDNVHFIGEIPYDEIPSYLSGFDVCLIPFRIIPLTLATNPVKFYEYISSGKAVVSVELPELKEHADICYLAGNKEDFISAIDEALQETDIVLIEKRRLVALRNTWEERALRIREYVDDRLFPLVSIVMVTYNNVEYTRACIRSVIRNTRYPNYELIIVDNSSTDDTRSYLSDLKKEYDHIRTIFNEENRGFAGGNNDGLRLARGKYLVLLNNDTLVTRGWLETLKAVLDNDADLGMVGPVSNSVGNEQMIPVGYNDMSGMEEWAEKYVQGHDLEIKKMTMLGFFCVMMKKDVFEQVGNLDENYGIGMFEDDDYCEAVKKSGYGLAYTKKVFIHHFGSVSFKKLEDEAYRRIWEKNKEYFEKKWNMKWTN